MRPILLQGHTRSITYIRYSREGDILFTCSKDSHPAAWYSDTGERLGTYEGHTGTVYSCDVSDDTKLLLTASGDQDVKLWEVETGEELFSWTHRGSARCVRFSQGSHQFLTVSDPFSMNAATLNVYELADSPEHQSKLPSLQVVDEKHRKQKIGQAEWVQDNRFILAAYGAEIRQIDPKTGSTLRSVTEHKGTINFMCFNKTRFALMTCSADHHAKLWDVETLEVMKDYPCDRPLNSGAISPLKEHIILGGGQDAQEVTTSAAAAGKFEVRFYHLVHGDELGRVRGHFGPVNTCAFHPDGRSFASGAEDGYVRVHHFDDEYFTMGDALDMSKKDLDAFVESAADDLADIDEDSEDGGDDEDGEDSAEAGAGAGVGVGAGAGSA